MGAIEKVLLDAAALAEWTGVLVATADADGLPHVAVADRVEPAGEGRIAVTYWFCPGTLANVSANPRISIVVWSREVREGYQILGTLDAMEDAGMLDGYSPRIDSDEPMPQVRERLVIRVENVLSFSGAPHSDLEPRVGKGDRDDAGRGIGGVRGAGVV